MHVSVLGDGDVQEAARIVSGVIPWDYVIGGGQVEASSILVAGPPGIGKSTLVLQVAERLSATRRVVYAGQEETKEQIKQRAKRIGVDASRIGYVDSVEVNDLAKVMKQAGGGSVLVVDSVQLVDDRYGNGPENQRKHGAVVDLIGKAKKAGVALILISQVNEKGEASGGARLRHVPDCTVDFEGREDKPERWLRVKQKNRFGAVGVQAELRMTSEGLVW